MIHSALSWFVSGAYCSTYLRPLDVSVDLFLFFSCAESVDLQYMLFFWDCLYETVNSQSLIIKKYYSKNEPLVKVKYKTLFHFSLNW